MKKRFENWRLHLVVALLTAFIFASKKISDESELKNKEEIEDSSED